MNTKITVWSVRWDNDHETGCNVYSTEAEARAFYNATAEGWWTALFGDEEMPADYAVAVDRITGSSDLNELTIERHEVALPAPVQPIVEAVNNYPAALQVIAGLLPAAESHVEDWVTGLEDGTYSDKEGLAEAEAAIEAAEALLAGRQAPVRRVNQALADAANEAVALNEEPQR